MNCTHDIHTHTLFSSCCTDPAATVEAYVRRAAELGHRIFGISDHLWDETVPGASAWYAGQSVPYVLEAKNCIPKDTGGVKVLFGAETEYCGMSDTLGITAESAKHFDYILVPHTHTHMKNFTMAEPPEIAAYRRQIADRLRATFDFLSDRQIGKMAAALNHNELYPLIADTFDFVGYAADFAVDSFERMLNNAEFVKLTQTVPVIIAHPFAPLEGELSVEIRRRIGIAGIRVRVLRKIAVKHAGIVITDFRMDVCFHAAVRLLFLRDRRKNQCIDRPKQHDTGNGHHHAAQNPRIQPYFLSFVFYSVFYRTPHCESFLPFPVS